MNPAGGRCPQCRGLLEVERIGRTANHPGRAVGFCPSCDAVVEPDLIPAEIPQPPPRRDLE